MHNICIIHLLYIPYCLTIPYWLFFYVMHSFLYLQSNQQGVMYGAVRAALKRAAVGHLSCPLQIIKEFPIGI